MEIVEATGHVLEAGKSSELTALLATVADATAMDGELRYAPKITRDLARAVVCRKYANGVLQLCHLVNIVDACSVGKDRWERFFFGMDKVRGSAMRAFLTEAIDTNGWRRPGFELVDGAVHIDYSDGDFALGFGRMPFLTALLETTIAMVGYGPVEQIFKDMTEQAADQDCVKQAASHLSRLIYDWLRDHLPGTQATEKFTAIVAFLTASSKAGSVLIDDENILKFWRQQNNGHPDAIGDFRTFRNTLGGFVDFLRAMEAGSSQSMVSYARPLGTDRDAGEVDPMLSGDEEAPGSWQTPLALLDTPPADAIKFLNKKERDGLEFLMECGPLAIDLPLSILRNEVFGAAQNRITQALRRKSPDSDLESLVRCEDLNSYGEHNEQLHVYEQHLLKVQKALLFALTSGAGDENEEEIEGLPEGADTSNVVSLFANKQIPVKALEQSKTAFRQLNRKGFSDDDLSDPHIREGYGMGAGALVLARDHLANYLVVLARLQAEDHDFEQTFTQDQQTFRDLFDLMYGEKK